MYEKIAWNNFCNTGDIESFLEYRKLIQLSEGIELQEESTEGDFLNESNKSEGNSN